MKKSYVKKFFKRSLIFLGVLFSSALVWANWSPKSYSQRVSSDSAVYEMFSISKPILNKNAFEKSVSGIKGVSACVYDSITKTAGIMRFSSELSNENLISKVKEVSNVSLAQKAIKCKKSGCPVTATKYKLLAIKEFLNFRS